MKVSSTKFRGLKVYNGKTHLDNRGGFRELFIKRKIKGFQGIFWCMSKSKRNVVRGLHIQKKINQAKYVSVVKGKIFDVALDLRKKSKTFGKYFAIILSDKNSKSIYIPKGLWFGFMGLKKSGSVIISLSTHIFHKKEINRKNLKEIKFNWNS